MSRSNLQTIIQAPVVTLVEAKNDNLKSGLAQCMAEMVAAQIFNQRQDNEVCKIYGVISSGTVWQFLELEGQNVVLDLEGYYLKNLPKLLGVLINFVS